MRKVWTSDEDQVLKELWYSEKSLQEMGDILDALASGVWSRAKTIGLPRRLESRNPKYMATKEERETKITNKMIAESLSFMAEKINKVGGHKDGPIKPVISLGFVPAYLGSYVKAVSHEGNYSLGSR